MSNIYRIGVALAMSSNHGQVLGALGRDLLGIDTKVKGLEKGFGRLKLAIGGALAIGAGVALLGALKGPLDEARKFEMAVTKFGNFGLGADRTREAAEFAKQMNITGSTYVENMKRMSEAQGVFRESGLSGEAALRGAKLAAPLLAKIDFANAALDDESKAKMHTAALAMLRFIEMRGGVNSPEQFNRIADLGFKAVQSSGGNISWEQLRQFSARAQVAGFNLSDEALFSKFEPLIGELKGSTAGQSLRTAYNRMNGIIRLPNQVAHNLVDAGIWDGSKVVWNSQGGIKSTKGNPLRDADLFAADPIAFYRKYISPMYDAKGLSLAARGRENALLFGSTGGGLFTLADKQKAAIDKSIGAQRKALGIDAAYKAAGGTLNGKIIDLQAKYTNLMERLGEAALPLAIKGLNVLIPLMTKLTAWMAANPGKMKLIVDGIVVAGAALIGLGTAMAGMAIFAGGWVAVAIAGIGALVGAIGAMAVIAPAALQKLVLVGKLFSDLVSGNLVGAGVDVHDLVSSKSAIPPAPKPTQNPQPAHVYLDGKKVGQVLAPHVAAQQAHALGATAVGPARYDPNASLAFAGGAYRR